jgi:hypothetical protein
MAVPLVRSTSSVKPAYPNFNEVPAGTLSV